MEHVPMVIALDVQTEAREKQELCRFNKKRQPIERYKFLMDKDDILMDDEPTTY